MPWRFYYCTKLYMEMRVNDAKEIFVLLLLLQHVWQKEEQ
jgi:hypothetical protein